MDLRTLDVAVLVCERLRDAVRATAWDEVAPGLDVAVTIGVATARGGEPWALFAAADAALLRAKRDGRGEIRSA